MTHATERAYRTAPRQSFSGGHTGHRIEPDTRQPSWPVALAAVLALCFVLWLEFGR